MIPMPLDAMQLHRAMAQLYATIESIAMPPGMTHPSPATLFLLACIGDQELNVTQIIKSGYWFGKNPTYPLGVLCHAGLAQRRNIQADKRIILYSLTEKGLALSERIRKELSSNKEIDHALPGHPDRGHAVLALMGASG